MRRTLLFLLLISVLCSCVPRKNLIYLQGEPVSLKKIREINDAPYKLQVHDIITIDIKADDSDMVSMFQKQNNTGVGIQNQVQGGNAGGGYFFGYSVDRHGNIRLPYLGEINVLGYTTEEVREKVEEKLKDYIKDGTEVFVNVRLDGIQYTIMGEVVSPGLKIIYQNQISILDAVTNAGDITLVGDRKHVEVLRMTPEGAKKFEIDLTKISALESEAFYIKPNDYINVKPLPQKTIGSGTTGLQSLSTIVSVFSLVTSVILIVGGL
jgi:polysaccharide export outer membrane protein